MIYKAEVVSGKGKRHYYGQTDRTFKERFYGHTSDLRHPSKAKSTSLSTYVWKIRNEGEDPTISWSKVKNARSYNPGNKNCNMCLEEKTTIARDKTKEILNKRSELMYKCLHKQRYLLENIVQMQVHEENDREHQEHAQEADVDHHSVNHVLQQEDHVQDGVVDHHSAHQVLQQQDHVQDAVVDHHSVQQVLQQQDHGQEADVDHHSVHQVLQQQDHVQEAPVDYHSVHHVLQHQDHVQEAVVDQHSVHQVLQQKDHVQEAVVDNHSVHHVLRQQDPVQEVDVEHHSVHHVLQQQVLVQEAEGNQQGGVRRSRRRKQQKYSNLAGME